MHKNSDTLHFTMVMTTPIIIINYNDRNKSRTRTNLDITHRNAVLHTLVTHVVDGKLPRGATETVSRQYDIHRHTVSSIWEHYMKGNDIGNRRSLSTKGISEN